jgi:AraC-like DNA-binding protein
MIGYQMLKPPSALTDYVLFFWNLEGHVDLIDDPFVHRALPDNCIELIFYYKGKLAISSLAGDEGNTFASGVFGPSQKFRQFKTKHDFSLFGVYLYPYSFKMLFNVPAHELCNAKVDSETLWGLEGRMLEEQIMLADSTETRIDLISKFLLDKVRMIRNHDAVFARQIKTVVQHNRLLSIPEFAQECNLSRRQFERKFKELSGFSPKDFFNIVRFKNVITELELGSKSLTQIAIDAGYYDQSHFTNEFRKFSGYTPREFLINHAKAVDMRATRDFKS